jgi:hypothetical protein
MTIILLLDQKSCLLLAAAAAISFFALAGCTGEKAVSFTGEYQVLKAYRESTIPPVIVGNSTITFVPNLDFPPGSLAIYNLCIEDVAHRNGIDAAS